MFNFYINDLPNITKCETFLFADDCALLFSNYDSKILNKEVNEEINLIKDYFDSNFLLVSIDKSNFLHFQPKNKKGVKINVNIGLKNLEEKNELTYLGVIIDNKLKFNEHFKKIYKKAKNGLNGLIMTKNQLNTVMTRMLHTPQFLDLRFGLYSPKH